MTDQKPDKGKEPIRGNPLLPIALRMAAAHRLAVDGHLAIIGFPAREEERRDEKKGLRRAPSTAG